MLELLMDPYNMATMKPNKVCVDLFFWFVCIYLQYEAVYAHVPKCTFISHLQETSKSNTLWCKLLSALPAARGGTRPCT